MFEVVVSGETSEAVETRAAVAGLAEGFVRDLRKLGYYGSAVVSYFELSNSDVAVEEAEPEEESAAVLAVDFASDRAAEVADELDVPAEAFEGLEPSSSQGYTVADVRKAAKG